MNTEEMRECKKKYYQENKEVVLAQHKKYREDNQDKVAEAKRRKWAELRYRVLDYYSSGKICCAICSEDRLPCLSVDHLNGGGNKHRREVGFGYAFYLWIERSNYPEGFRVLCMNCQFVTRSDNYRGVEI